MKLLEIILIGVFSGVITSLIIYLLKLIFIKVLIPWYQELSYKGIDVSGSWNGKIKSSQESVKFSAKLTLEQSAHNLSGTYVIVKYVNEDIYKITSMNVSGTVWEGFVSLTCRTVSNKNLSFGSMLLKINDGNLNGHQVFRNLAGNSSGILENSLKLTANEKNT